MANGTQLNEATTVGDKIATLDVGGVKHEQVINEFLDGAGNPIMVSGTNPLPVTDTATQALLTTIAALLASQSFIEVAATRAAVLPSTTKRLVYVQADETNNGDISLYIYNGTALKFLQTVA